MATLESPIAASRFEAPPSVTLSIPLPVIRIKRYPLSIPVPELRVPTWSSLKPSRSLLHSIVLHFVLLLTGYGLHVLSERGKVESVEIDVDFTQVAQAPAGVKLSAGSKVLAAGTQDSFRSLLAQATAGISLKSSGVRRAAPDVDVSRVAHELSQRLATSAVGTAKNATGSVPEGKLAKTAVIPFEKIATTKPGTALSSSDKESIRRVIAARENAFRACQEKALLVDPSLSGQAGLLFTLATNGQVSDTTVEFEGQAAARGRELLETCLKAEGAKLRFPPTVASSQIRFSLLLR